ncbi:MAG TPA: tRNA pseudouridine(38-40) synthase TruA [Chthoniobacterales bacterium]
MPNESPAAPAVRVQRLKLTIAYDGGPFSGWQSQANSETIQDRIEAAFASISGGQIRVHGAGRTDAGVHALGQCAHADVPAGKLPALAWMNALNATLPPQIRIVACRFAPPPFHARFSARGKIYRYRIFNGDVLLPLEISRAWHVSSPLAQEAMESCAAVFQGRHDFASFSANRGKKVESTIRTIRSVRIRRRGPLVVVEVDGEGFLYKMVRLMVGTIIRCGLSKESTAEVRERLRARGSVAHGRLVAPACGLTLVRVRY